MKISVASHDDSSTHQSFRLGKKLGEGKFDVYHVSSASTKVTYALKVFPKTSLGAEYYKKELFYSNLCHPNVIQYVPIKCITSDFYGLFTEFAKHGDFLALMISKGGLKSETLLRTYFHQLIDGLEYIHSRGVAHLDLKLENLVLANDFSLKIIDFDQAQPISDNDLTSAGSPNCRAPEVIQESCQDLASADIYSAGVILFALKVGEFPFIEENNDKGTYLYPYSLFVRNNQRFWNEKAEFLEGEGCFDEGFMELVNGMLRHNPKKRLTIEEIKSSKWYKGPVLSKENLRVEMKKILKSEKSSEVY